MRGHAGDLRHSDEVDRLVAVTLEDFGAVDVLVNNGSARVPPTPWPSSPTSCSVRSSCLTFDATVYAIRAALPHMIARGAGRSSTRRRTPRTGAAGPGALVAYGAAKAAILNLTKALAVQHGPHGVRVNAIVPAQIESPNALAWLRDVREQGQLDAWLSQIPLGRMGRAEEVAAVALFLASDDASFVTGGEYTVDGGLAAQLGAPRLLGRRSSVGVASLRRSRVGPAPGGRRTRPRCRRRTRGWRR